MLAVLMCTLLRKITCVDYAFICQTTLGPGRQFIITNPEQNKKPSEKKFSPGFC
jgi:hypothetical protein